jgi:hypothetical protein
VERIRIVRVYRQSFLVAALRQIALSPSMVRESLFDKLSMERPFCADLFRPDYPLISIQRVTLSHVSDRSEFAAGRAAH